MFLEKLKEKRRLQQLGAAVLCGMVFTMGGQGTADAAAGQSICGAGTEASKGSQYLDADGKATSAAGSAAVEANNGTYVTKDYSNASTTGSNFTVKSGTWCFVNGGYSDGGVAVEGNTVNILDGATTKQYGGGGGKIYGGYNNNGAANSNTVNISGGEIGGFGSQSVFGGSVTTGGSAEANTVNISGGRIAFSVFGGYVYMGAGSVKSNTVNITGGDIMSGGVFSGYINSGTGSAEDNTVNITGGTINLSVIGGQAKSGDAKNNTVNLGGYLEKGTVITQSGWKATIGREVYGGDSKSGTSSGNAVNVLSVGNRVGDLKTNTIQSLNFYVPASVTAAADYMLTVGDYSENMFSSGTNPSELDLTNVPINVVFSSLPKLQTGDSVKLLFAKGSMTIDPAVTQTVSKLKENDFQDVEVALYVEADTAEVAIAYDDLSDFSIMTVAGQGLKGKVTGRSNNENSKSLVETQAAGLTILTAGADMLAGAGFENASLAVATGADSANSLQPFAAIGGNKSKVKSGSHVDVKGWNINLGLAKEIANKNGKLLLGPVLEYGRGSYDSYLDNGFHGAGDTHYLGAGVMARQTNTDGFYYEGSLRGGEIKNDYHANSNRYDSDANYFAAHLGAGKILQLDESNTLDCYGKFFCTRQFSDDTTLYANGAGKDLHFDAVNSNRLLLGGRLTHRFDARNSAYAGLAWQHEFSGTARATLGGMSTPAPSVKGETGILELGWKLKPGQGSFETGLGFTGSIGKQKGLGVNASFQWSF